MPSVIDAVAARDIERPASVFADPRTAPSLRSYQHDAVARITAAQGDGLKRILYVSPTGTGKTIVAAEIVRQWMAAGKRVLFLAHRLELLSQCSRKLSELGLDHEIAGAGYTPDARKMCTIGSIATLKRRTAIPTHYDLCIIDEAHRADGDSIAASLPNAAKLGLTATPCRYVGGSARTLGLHYDTIIECPMSRRDLISSSFLVPSRVVAPSLPDLAGVPVKGSDYEPGALAAILGDAKLIGHVVEHWLQFARGRPTIAFACSIAHGHQITEAFIRAGVKAQMLTGEDHESIRADHLAALRKGKVHIAVSVAVLTEGIDVPEVQCVLLIRATLSLIVYMQAIGRGVRPARGKTDCLVIDHGANVIRHGPPDMERAWTLDAREKSKAPTVPDPLRRCSVCFAVFISSTRICPYCRASTAVTKGIRYDEAGHLIEYDPEMLAAAEAEHLRIKERADQERALKGKFLRQLFGYAGAHGIREPKRFVFQHLRIQQQQGIPFGEYMATLRSGMARQ